MDSPEGMFLKEILRGLAKEAILAYFTKLKNIWIYSVRFDTALQIVFHRSLLLISRAASTKWNKYGSVLELRSTFSHTKSIISDFSLV